MTLLSTMQRAMMLLSAMSASLFRVTVSYAVIFSQAIKTQLILPSQVPFFLNSCFVVGLTLICRMSIVAHSAFDLDEVGS